MSICEKENLSIRNFSKYHISFISMYSSNFIDIPSVLVFFITFKFSTSASIIFALAS